METDGGGWTLLAYSGDTATYGGVPYPGQDSLSAPYCLSGAGPATLCSRGSGLPREDLPGIFAASTEFGQAQATPGGLLHDPYAPKLIDYDFAGRYHYGTILADLELEYGPGTCTPFAVGTYFDLVGTAELEGTTVQLAKALRSPLAGNYGSIDDTYTWSVGSPDSPCAISSSAPASYLGTWQEPQYGPQALGASGAFSVWIR
jgi:hypothetical protein